jgi:threonine/homoserine/homoserine lactone efflux protein
MLDTGLMFFMLATVTLNVTPGPDMLYVIAHSVSQGRPAGIVSALGIAGGCIVHTLAVAFGLAGVMLAVPIAYEIVRYAGAAYLAYLGLRTLLNGRKVTAEAAIQPDNLRAIFLQGVITNVLNPKVALFFLAFLPQFADASRGSVAAQIVFLGALFITSGTIVNVGVALAASYTGGRLRSHRGSPAVFRWITGSVFLGLGFRLAMLERR